MIPAIGLMIAAYTLTRLLGMLFQKDVNVFVKIIAVIAMIVILIATMDLFSAASKTSGLGRF